MHLAARVTLWLLVLLGAAAAVTLFGIGWFQSKAVGRDAQETAKLLAQSIESSLEVGMLNNSPEDIQNVVANVQKSLLIDQVAVYGREGTSWVSSDVGYVPGAEQRSALSGTLSNGTTGISNVGDSLSVFIPIYNKPECGRCHDGDGAILGAVAVTVDEKPLRHELSKGTRYSFLFSLVPLLLGLVAALVAGSSSIHWLTFTIYNALGALTWASGVSVVGYFGAGAVSSLLPWVRGAHLSVWALAVASVIALAGHAVFEAVHERRMRTATKTRRRRKRSS